MPQLMARTGATTPPIRRGAAVVPVLSAALAVALSLAPVLAVHAQAGAPPAAAKAKPGATGPLKERAPELEGLGEQYDLAKYDECKRRTPQDSKCEIYRLKRKPAPETWPFHATPPIKWPDPPQEQVYKAGMGPIDYWRALCKAEGGEFIYKTVKDVKSIYQIRPRPKEISYAFRDRYVMEDPYGYMSFESGTLDGIPGQVTGPGWGSRKSSGKYSVFETPILQDDIHWTRQKHFSPDLFQPAPPGKPYQRFFGYDRRDRKSMRLEYTDKIQSRYGWTWRGVRRPFDREVGVAGGELAVVDLKTGEMLGLRRGFVLGARELGGSVGWGGGNVCPEYSRMPGIGEIRRRSKDFDFSLWFINKVLIPVGECKGCEPVSGNSREGLTWIESRTSAA
jgi:hypothetical protein